MHLNHRQLQTLKEYQPMQRSEKSLMQAAVSIILREGEHGLEFLLMQRAKHENDPWSGQMSFPGGKIDPDDNSAKAAAIRETKEEVGLCLYEHDYLGQLDDLYGLKVDDEYSVHVACFIFMPKRELEPVGNYEVEDLVWLPLNYLDSPRNAVDFYHPLNAKAKLPAVLINAQREQILWGLSLRILAMFYALLDLPMKVMSEQELNVLSEEHSVDSRKIDKNVRKTLNGRG